MTYYFQEEANFWVMKRRDGRTSWCPLKKNLRTTLNLIIEFSRHKQENAKHITIEKTLNKGDAAVLLSLIVEN